MKMPLIRNGRLPFQKDEDGSITPFALFTVLIFCVIGGLAVDFNKAVSERAQLQTAADSAAHAALYKRELESASTAKAEALQIVAEMLPAAAYKDALLQSDIEFGFLDNTTGEFVADSSSRSAVRVSAWLTTLRNNASRNILLGLIGQDTFDINVVSVFATYYPGCLNEGYVAQGIVDLQSRNNYRDGFCIHSNSHVEIQQNNTLEPGVTVGMPSLDNLQIAASGFRQNDGLEEALREDYYNVRLLRQMNQRFQSLRDGSAAYASEAGVSSLNSVMWPVQVSGNGGGGGNGNGNNGGGNNNNRGGNNNNNNNTTTTTTSSASGPRFTGTDLGKKTVEPASFDEDYRIYQLECSGNGDVTFSGGTYTNFALITNCDVNFSNGTILEGVIVATEGDVMAVQTQMGRNDGCGAGGGAQLWIQGDFKSSSNFDGYGAQIIAQGDVQFPARSNGTEGLSVIAGGRIDATSNANMAFCDGGGTENFQRAPLFRMAL